MQTSDGVYALSGFTGSICGNSIVIWLVKTNGSGYSPNDQSIYNSNPSPEKSIMEIQKIPEILMILPILIIVSYLFYRKRKIRKVREQNSELFPLD